MRLAGKVGIITGAAGGIGGAAATAFTREGATVGLLDLPGEPLEQLASGLAECGVPLGCDVTDEASVRATMGVWASRYQRADFVYVCAGIQLHGEDGSAGDVSLETWQRTLSINLTGAFLTVKHSLPLLCRATSGSLILCGSPTGMTMAGRGYAAYAASKAGMMSLARTVAADYASAGIRANVVIPGTTQTPLIASQLEDAAARNNLLRGAPIGRLAQAEDLVGIAVFLASDESRYATGATFAVDGGLTVR